MFNQEFIEKINHEQINSQAYQQSYSASDLQYDICNRFIKIASEQLYHKQLELIQQSTCFIERISDSMIQKDISSTQESLSFQPAIDDDDVFSQTSKNVQMEYHKPLNKFKKNVQKKLMLISQDSIKTINLLKMVSFQLLSEKQLKKMDIKLMANEQQHLILRKRVSDLEKQNKLIKEQSDCLRSRIRQMNEQVRLNKLANCKSTDNLKTFSNYNSLDKMKKHLEEKEMHIFKKEKQIKSIQQKIQCGLDSLQEKGCQKCCSIVRRIKESIMKYRTYLEEQAILCDTLYNNYKKLFY